jgi:signal transduction histidine kinase
VGSSSGEALTWRLARGGAGFLLLNVIGVSLLLLLFSSNATSSAADQDRAREAERLRAAILSLDEVLTMSARMYAATGDARWRVRYERAAPELDEQLARAAVIVSADAAVSVNIIAQSNLALVSMEREVFRLVTLGESAAAAELLDSERYTWEKERYAHGLAAFVETLRESGDLARLRLQHRIDVGWVVLWLFLGLDLVLAAGYALELRRVRGAYDATEAVAEQALSDLRFVMDAAGLGTLRLRQETLRLGGRAPQLFGLREAGPVPGLSSLAALIDSPQDLLRALEGSGEVNVTVRAREGRYLLLRGQKHIQAGEQAADVAVLDDTSRAEAERALTEMTRSLEERVRERGAALESEAARTRELARLLSRTETDERQRISNVLHDDIQQGLVAARLHVSIGTPAHKVVEILDEAIAATRTLSQTVAPPSLGMSLKDALEGLAKSFQRRYTMDVRLGIQGEAIDVTDNVRDVVHDAVRELLFNAHKHAECRQVCVTIHVQGMSLVGEVTDDGKGLSAGAIDAGLGLRRLHARLTVLGGALAVGKHAGGGTQVRFVLPIGSAVPAIISGG